MKTEIDSNGRATAPVVVEKPADDVEQHIHRLRALTKALLCAWQAELVSPAWFILRELGDTYGKLVAAMIAYAFPQKGNG